MTQLLEPYSVTVVPTVVGQFFHDIKKLRNDAYQFDNCTRARNSTPGDLDIIYHKFPLKYLRYHQWVQAIPTHLLDLPIRKETYVCSAHFVPEAYKQLIYEKLGIYILRKYAYPTIFNNNDNKGNETTEDIEKSPQQEIKETLSQTGDTSVKTFAENIEELEEENLSTETLSQTGDTSVKTFAENIEELEEENLSTETLSQTGDTSVKTFSENIEELEEESLSTETLSQTGDTSVKISAEDIEELEEENLPTETLSQTGDTSVKTFSENIEELEEESLSTETLSQTGDTSVKISAEDIEELEEESLPTKTLSQMGDTSVKISAENIEELEEESLPTETLSQTGDTSVKISAENIKKLEEESLSTEILSQTGDTSVKISAENIEVLEEESRPTEYVQKCLHPRDQTTQTDMLQPYDLDDYDVIFEKDEIQSDEESDNNLHEVVITTNKVQPITELGNNLFEVTMSSENTKLVRNEIHPDKKSDSSMLMPHNICQATGQTIEISSDSVQGKVESPVLLHHDAYKDMRQIRPELSNSIQKKDSLMLVPHGICQIKGQAMQVCPASIQESPLFLHNNQCQVTVQAIQKSSDSTQDKESPLFLHNNQCQVTVQAIQKSSDSTQGKESPLFLHNNKCQVTVQAIQKSSDSTQGKKSPLFLHNNQCQVAVQAIQKSPDSIQGKVESSSKLMHHNTCQAMQEPFNFIQAKESPTLLHHNLYQVTKQTMQESSNLTQEKILLPKDCIYKVTGQTVQKSSDSLGKKKFITLKNCKLLTVASPLLHNHTHHTHHVIGQTMQKSSDTLEKKESLLRLYDTCHTAGRAVQKSSLQNSLQKREFPLCNNTCRVAELAQQIYYEPPPVENYGYDLLDDWPDEAVFILIDAYKQHEHLLRFEEVTVKQFWTIIASQLAKKNYNPTDFQCRLKMKDLNYTYKIIKNHAKDFNNQAWKFFDVMDKLFNKQPSVVSIITSDNNNPNLSFPKLYIDKSCPTSHVTVYEPPFKRVKQVGDDNLGHTMQDS
ncbi:nucleoprotein TPR-like [Odontomachus brunneus]|uniref:nucleoprotein TPR-like n=1 Tax=Odontomachus brunneus TaxID=486640 RepID=UPI0013F28A07|nr:nucleoprotein TPR-like [Odontomachus brunneus]